MTRRSDRRRQSFAADLWRAEEEWRNATCASEFLRVDVELSERKWRLFAMECCRAILPMCVEPWHREAFEQSERIADSVHPGAECRGISQLQEPDNRRRRWSDWYEPEWYFPRRPAAEVWAERAILDLAVWREGAATRHTIHRSLLAALAPESNRVRLRKEWDEKFADTLREIAGDPFGLVTFDSNWRTFNATSLARMMYHSREFSPMPILADALQDAGCDNEDILNHCRDANATHIRGCWVVDLVLGRQ